MNYSSGLSGSHIIIAYYYSKPMFFIQENQVDRIKWKEFLLGNPYLSPFQSPEYYDFFNKIPNYKAMVFAVEDKEKITSLAIVCLLKEAGPIGYFSRRSIIYGGPLLPDDPVAGEASAQLLLKGIQAVIRKHAIYLETYNFHDYSKYRKLFEKNDFEYEAHLNVQLDITGQAIDDILQGMKSNRRREISNSFREGASINLADSIDQVRTLYNVLVDLYNDRVKLPLPPYSFFKNLFLSEIGKVFLVYHDGQIIGGSFCIYLPNKSIYTYYYCGLREYKKSIFPSHLAVFAAIEFGVNHQLALVDLMGAGKPNKEYGVRDFKVRFGGSLVENGRFLKIYSPLLFAIGKTGLKLLKFIKK